MFGILGVLALMCAVAFAVPADISSAEDDTKYVSSFSLEPKTDDYAKVSGTLDYVLKYSLVGSSATAKATLLDSDGNSVGTATMSSSTLNSYSPSTNVNVTLPSTAGYYTLKVTVTEGEATYERFAEVKAVDPVKMSVTLENKGEVARTFKAAFYFQEGEGWVVVDGSEQSVTVEAKSTKDVTYDYITKDISGKTFCLKAVDSSSVGGEIVGLGEEHAHTFYTSGNDYTLIEYLCVGIIVILLIVALWIYRKPIKNRGKPKARR